MIGRDGMIALCFTVDPFILNDDINSTMHKNIRRSIKAEMTTINLTNRRERKRQKMRQNLTETAMELFSSHGYDNVTMEQIAETADVAKGTLYNHFPIKEALVASWVHQEIARDSENLFDEIERHQIFIERMKALLAISKAWCEANREYLPAYLRYRLLELGGTVPGKGMHTLDGVGWIFVRVIRHAQDRGELRDDLAAEHLAEFLAHMYLGALMRWLRGNATNLEAEFETMLSLFCDGVSSA
ncbi:TetR/AcrR family transcriptional regulator [uncultured Nitratireductor sp.]|uniref:TetR/AcrR family transcriptional regulator n=1 Tax=uncultured Nitratireductor sp. TaxID=520953 RepID=UPI0025EFB50C|nr:TetR/AcrR family transcriptional regulator [uncultured Nitratireductor sp.]